MNKMLKLPLFLGVCGTVCAGLLAGVYALTNPIVQKAKAEKANAAYISMYSEFGVVGTDVTTEEVDNIAGCSLRAIIVNANVKGIAYTCQASGYGGTISFQIAFANGKYLAYTDLGNSETNGYGKVVIAGMTDTIAGVDASTSLEDYAAYSTLISGRSITGKALKSTIELCRTDYLAWYEANK